jgi:hypothetical protein
VDDIVTDVVVTDMVTPEIIITPENTETLPAPSETEIPNIIEITPEVITSPIVGSETPSPFNTIYTENFETEPLSNWSLGEGWTRAQTENGFALQSTQMLQRALFNPLIGDTEITFQVRWDAGRVHLHTHSNGLNEYQFSLSSDLQAILYRNGVIVATALMPEFVSVQWQTITYRKIGSNIEILLNNAPLLQFTDVEPLTSGQIALSAEGMTRAQWDEMTIKSGEVVETVEVLATEVPLTLENEDSTLITLNSASFLQVYCPISYIVVKNSSELLSAINTGCYPRIYLMPNVYEIDSVTLNRDLSIFGMGELTRINRIAGSTSSMFNLQSHNLRIEYLVIDGKNHVVSQYGGIFSNGNLSINNLIVINSFAQIGGGVASVIQLNVKNSFFFGNNGGGNAGVFYYGTTNTPAMIDCSEFSTNGAKYGGAILFTPYATGTISRSRFSENFAENNSLGGAIYNENQPGNTSEPFIVLDKSLVVSSPTANSIAGGFKGALSGTINQWFTTTGAFSEFTRGGVKSSECNRLPLLTSTPTPAEELYQYYGVDIRSEGTTFGTWNSLAGWSQPEANEILYAVRMTAIALAIQSETLAPIDAFNLVMRRRISVGEFDGQDDPFPYLIIRKIPPSGIPYCLTTIQIPTKIECFYPSSFNLSQYTMVHELGHVFNERSDSSYNPLNQPSIDSKALKRFVEDTSTNILLDSNNRLLLGNGNFMSSLGLESVWLRGQDGWGDGPANTFNGVISFPVGRIVPPPDFQQNSPAYLKDSQAPSGYRTVDGVDMYDEAGADLFLNWVYRMVYGLTPDNNPKTGFRNIYWRVQENCNTLVGCIYDQQYPGDIRLNWMTNVMSQIFTQHNWKAN